MILGYDDFFQPLVDNFAGLGIDDGAARIVAQNYMDGILNKGLNTTGTVSDGSSTGGDALKQQDLFKQIAVAEMQAQQHAVVWNWIKKTPTYTDVVEKTIIDAWGGQRRGGFLNLQSSSGDLLARDPNITRGALPVKWMGGRYQVFRSALAIQSLRMSADPIIGGAEEVASTSTLQQLILNANEMVIHGDNDKNTHEPDGILKQIRDANSSKFITRIDLKGLPITPENMPDIEQNLRSKGGIFTDMFWGSQSHADFRKAMRSYIRTENGNRYTDGTYSDQELIMGLGGNPEYAKFHTDNFLDPLDAADGAVGPKPPLAPTTVAVTVTGTGAANAWGSDHFLAAGTYNYKVRAVGTNGWTSMVAGDAAAAPNGAQKVAITITNAAGNTLGDVAYFEVFRGNGATGVVKYLGRVAGAAIAAGATTVFYDDGEFVPGTSSVFAVTNRQIGLAGRECMVRQLYPATKVRLPNDVMAEQAAWIMGFTPQLLVPQFGLVLENVGRYQ